MLLAAHMRINPMNFIIDRLGAKSKQRLGDLKIGLEDSEISSVSGSAQEGQGDLPLRKSGGFR
jgi:hypothetical protein